VPSVLKNPDFLQRANMEVIDRRGKPIDPETLDLGKAAEYRFRQRPGASNSLGLVKFLFPNPYNVYLHDTPAESLFGRVTRSLSHGCVRLEEPERLAEYVLSDQPDWTADRIKEAMHGADQKTVKLRTPLPVYLGYFTARVGGDGTVEFRRDIYGIDTRQAAQLSAVETRDAAVSTAVAAQMRPSKSAVSGAF
jgi:L,D-transpeptidase YcbB